jgi:hypothetical protein
MHALPSKRTLFKVWFGQKPKRMHLEYCKNELARLNDPLHYNSKVLKLKDLVLTEIEKRVAKYNS